MKKAQFGLALAMILGTALSASAQFKDPVTGFGIAPPAPFTVEPSSHRQFDVMVGLRSSTGAPPSVGRTPDGTPSFICQAGFKAAAQNNDLTKAEINAFMSKPEWRKVIKATIEVVFQVEGEGSFTLNGYRGVELRVRPKTGPGADDVRALMSFVETAKGRTTLICLTDKASFPKALAQFRSVRGTMTAPE